MIIMHSGKVKRTLGKVMTFDYDFRAHNLHGGWVLYISVLRHVTDMLPRRFLVLLIPLHISNVSSIYRPLYLCAFSEAFSHSKRI